MTIHYIPNVGFNAESKEVKWGDKRNLVRQVLSLKYEQDDGVLDNSQFFDGDPSFNIVYKRDIYENFTTIFNGDDCLTELEVHSNVDIIALGISLIFGRDINDILNEFKRANNFPREIENGKFLFENLKMSIGSSESMGGDGNGLGYFYAGQDIAHLID